MAHKYQLFQVFPRSNHHPFFLQNKIDFSKLDLFHLNVNKCVMAHSVIDGKLAAYFRAVPAYNERQHPLFPLGAKDVGRIVYKYVHKPILTDMNKSLLSRWSAPWVVISVAGESFCTVKSLFLVRGHHVYADATIDLLYPLDNYDAQNDTLKTF